MPELTAVKKLFAWERDLLKRQAARAQERSLGDGLEEGCVFCGVGPWAWAYPMQRVAGTADGGEFLLPPWLPVCGACHEDVENARDQALAAKLHEAYKGRRNRQMREILPLFLQPRGGPPLARRDAAHLVRQERGRKQELGRKRR